MRAEASGQVGDPSPKGWYRRGYLPHFEGEAIQHVTFHLADSLPVDVLRRLTAEVEAAAEREGLEDVRKSQSGDWRSREYRIRVEAWLDAGHGSCVLAEAAVGAMVENSLTFFDGQRYKLLAWVVMPNHVHVLFQPMDGWSVAKIVASWKKFTATRICAFRREANQEIGVPGDPAEANQEIGVPGDPAEANQEIGVHGQRVWHREYWDRYMRDRCHFQQAMDYGLHSSESREGGTGEERWRLAMEQRAGVRRLRHF